MSFAQDAPATADRPPENELLLNTDQGNTADNPTLEDNPMPGVGFGDFLRVIIVLAIVIALIYAFVWMLKKFTGSKAEGAGAIHLYSTQPLKGDASLHLVEAGKRIFLIGSSGNSVNLISEIDDKESMDEIRLNASMTPQKVSGGFARLFRDRFGPAPVEPANEYRTDAKTTVSESDPASFLRKQRERLEDL